MLPVDFDARKGTEREQEKYRGWSTGEPSTVSVHSERRFRPFVLDSVRMSFVSDTNEAHYRVSTR